MELALISAFGVCLPFQKYDSKSVGGNTVWVQVPPPAPASKTACFLVFRGTGGFSFVRPPNGPCFSSAVFRLSFCQMAKTFANHFQIQKIIFL